ncbi:MAG: hypothetical protein ACRD2P_14085 [Terriglobia bacterium]
MNHPTLIAVFVVIAAVAIFIQMLIFLGFFLIARRVYKAAHLFSQEARPSVEALARGFRDVAEIVSVSKESIKTVAGNASEVSQMVRGQAASLDAALSDIADRTRSQVERIDLMISSLVSQVETTAGMVQRTVLGPIQQMSALAKGFQASLDFFLSRRHSPTVREATQDEEMFI